MVRHRVLRLLEKRGALPAQCYGEEKAIASNGTAKDRAANRRTEFNITGQ